jgi:Amidohydrolase family
MRAAIGTQRGFDNEDARNAGKASVDEMQLTCRQVLEFATIEGARACGMDGKIGSLTPGKRADVILVRTDTWSMTPLNNPIGHLSTTPIPAWSTPSWWTAKWSSATASSLLPTSAASEGSPTTRVTTSCAGLRERTGCAWAASGSRSPIRRRNENSAPLIFHFRSMS